MSYISPIYNSSYAIKQEIQRFESVHPSIYAIYDLIESISDKELQDKIHNHVVCIEDSFVNSQEWTLNRGIPELRLGVLGTAQSGKSALVHRYLTGSYMLDESPEGGRFKKEVSVPDAGSCLLLIRDEGGPPDAQFAAWCDACVFVFALDCAESLDAVYQYYGRVAQCRSLADLPLLLVGTQDTISESRPRVIDEIRTRKAAQDLRRCPYFETCATYGHNVDRVFQEAMLANAPVAGISSASTNTMFANAPVAVPYGYDPVLFNDPAILEDLLQTQSHYAPHPYYCPDIQPNIEFEMRRTVVEWLRDVCADANFLDGLANSVQLLDRYLSKTVAQPEPNDMQLLAAACMFITSKIKAVEPMSAMTVVYYTDNYIELGQLLIVELHIAKALDWDLVGVTVYDVTFSLVRYLQRDLVIGEMEAGLLLGQADFCLVSFLLDHESLRHPVSHLAAASVHYLAWRELSLPQHELHSIEQRLLKLIHVEPNSQSWQRSRSYTRRRLQQHFSEQPAIAD